MQVAQPPHQSYSLYYHGHLVAKQIINGEQQDESNPLQSPTYDRLCSP